MAVGQPDVDHIGMGVQMDVTGFDQGIAVQGPVPGRAVLPQLIPEDLRIEGQWVQVGDFLLPVVEPVFVWPQFEGLVRPGVIRVEVLPGNGPSAFGHPIALCKIDGVEGGAQARPVPRCAAEEMQAGRHKGVIPLPGGRAIVELLDFRLVFKAAPFQHDNLFFPADPVQGHGDAGCTGAHDANVALDQGLVFEGPGVCMHGLVLLDE